MACSKYEYVKIYEDHRIAMPQTFMVARIDGRGFTKFCNAHKFVKPNDIRAINLMNKAAFHVCQKFKQIFLAYGQSDEYSFAFVKDAELFNRRIDKIQTCIVSLFTSAYVFHWKGFFEGEMKEIPSFDCRVVLYPNLQIVKDYFRWRQVDCHINNLYNTVFWCLMKTGMKNTEVEQKLKDTNSSQKNEILFSQFGLNYNTIEAVYRKGSLICYKAKPQKQKSTKLHGSIISYLKNSKNQIKLVNESTAAIIKRLQHDEEDKECGKVLIDLLKQLQQIETKYQVLEQKIVTSQDKDKDRRQMKEEQQGKEQVKKEQVKKEQDKKEQVKQEDQKEELKGKNKPIGKWTQKKKKVKYSLQVCNDDLIKQEFWAQIKLE